MHQSNDARNQQHQHQLDNIATGNGTSSSNNYNNKDNSLVGNNRQGQGQITNFSNSTTKDISRDFSTSQDNTDRGSISDQAFQCSASSVESLPSASGSSKCMNFNIFIFNLILYDKCCIDFVNPKKKKETPHLLECVNYYNLFLVIFFPPIKK